MSEVTNLVPIVIENTPKGERSYDIYSYLLKQRIIFMQGVVTSEMANAIVAQMLFLDAEDNTQPIKLYINSPGGSVTAGLGIYDAMQFVTSPVHTFVLGQAASMGSFIANAGAAGHRYVMPESTTMVHRVSSGFGDFSGNVHHMEDQLEETKRRVDEATRLNLRLTELYVRHNTAGKTIADFQSIMRFDTYLSAEQAVQLGVADAVLRKLP